MISLGSRLIACCKLATTSARQLWRHNYVIDRNEYLFFTLLESTNPWVYSLQFLFKSTNNSWRYERKCEWVFFSEHSVNRHWRWTETLSVWWIVMFSAQNHRHEVIDGRVGGGNVLGSHQYLHNTPADYKYVSLLTSRRLVFIDLFICLCLQADVQS